jgi:hypothetical protein
MFSSSQLRGITGITQGCSLDLLKIQIYGCPNLRSEQNNASGTRTREQLPPSAPVDVSLSRHGIAPHHPIPRYLFDDLHSTQ